MSTQRILGDGIRLNYEDPRLMNFISKLPPHCTPTGSNITGKRADAQKPLQMVIVGPSDPELGFHVPKEEEFPETLGHLVGRCLTKECPLRHTGFCPLKNRQGFIIG